jgi:hypothetical protein
VAEATPCPKNGVAGPPHFWPRGGRPPHTGSMGVAEATPRPLGVVRPPRKAKKKKKKNVQWVWDFGGGFDHPLPAVRGGRSHAQALGGWSGHPQRPTHSSVFFFFFFFFGGLSGWPGHPQRPGGGFGHPHMAGMGWPATPWPKMGWSGHPIFWARSHPDFFPFFFFFFFFSKP